MTLNLVKGEFSSLEEALRAQVQLMQEKSEKLLLMVAKRDNTIAQQSIVIDDLRSQLETPINFDPDPEDEE